MGDKWRNVRFYTFCILVGIITGVVTVPYRYLLIKSATIREFLFSDERPWWFSVLAVALMWSVGMGIYWMVKKRPMISGSGIPQVEGAISGRFDFKNPFKALVSKFAGGLLGIGMGLSLGREGPSVQMGAFVAKLVARFSKASTAHQKYLITAGASAGLSSAFTAPLASTIFVIEEVEKFDSPKIAISSLLGGIAAGWIAKFYITGNAYSLIDTTIPQGLDVWHWILVFLAFAILLSFVGKAFNVLLLRFQSMYAKSKIPVALKILAVVTVTYILGYFISDLVAGGEAFLLDQAQSTSTGLLLLSVVIIIKLFFTPLCYATGFPGGIFLPLLVIGGLTGKWFALLLTQFGIIAPHNFGFFMLIGMSAVFAAVVRSPITGLILILEMTGKFDIFFPMIVVVGITFYISEIMGVKPIYDSLYARLLPKNVNTSVRRMLIPFEVGQDSYMQGKRIKDIELPQNCSLVNVYRKDKLYTSPDEILRVGDKVEIEVESRDLEKLYRSFRSMANE